jgi:CRISPR/Cas system-associated protein endoribonuclease Cas2
VNVQLVVAAGSPEEWNLFIIIVTEQCYDRSILLTGTD